LIISLLVEVQKGRKSLEAAIAEIQVGLARPEGPVLTQAAEICRRMFAPEACVGPLADMAREVAGLFHEIAPHLPQRS
jgi:hypothetical protein